MNNNELKLKTIYDLLGMNFFIPDYQRGYRWQRRQVRNLLDDIWNFKDICKPNDFYCLQPIVIKELSRERKSKFDINENEIWYEVIDGQQRLTTIRIIISYIVKDHLRRPISDAYPDKTEFAIKYETRKDSQTFLDNIQENKKNIDYFHIYEAYYEIKEWFKKKNYNEHNKFLEIFLANENSANSVKVIWYEVKEPNTKEIEVFTRINIGKIPLTNAELVKALFLQENNFTDKAFFKQLQIATEWDLIEKTLQDDSFWFFIYNTNNPLKYDNRIEYIFDLKTGKKNDHEYYHTFLKFQDDFSTIKTSTGKPDIDKIWLSVKEYFQCFDEWYKEPELYHLIGFLIELNTDINTIIDAKKAKKTKDGEEIKELRTKIEFKEYLRKEIKNKIKCKSEDIDNLEYGNKNIKNILLLFNIQTIIKSEKTEIRFPFDKYKNESWDIEHVRSLTDKQIVSNSRKDWAIDILEYFTGIRGYSEILIDGKSLIDIQNEIIDNFKNNPDEIKISDYCKNMINIISDDKNSGDEFIRSKVIDILKYSNNGIKIHDYCKKLIKVIVYETIEDDDFKEIYDLILKEFNEDNSPDDIDSIYNLALLDAETNRSYKNAMFPIKRKRIIENDKNGIFVPICTKNLFLKYYSKRLFNVMYWSDSDANDYLNAIKVTLKDFLM